MTPNAAALRRALAPVPSTAAGNLRTDGNLAARLGYNIVPGKPCEKKPVIKTGQAHGDAATRDLAQIEQWARSFPDADALIVCKASEITVLDVDTKAGGDADALAAEHPDWVCIRTGLAPPRSDKYPNSLEGMLGAQFYFRDFDGTFSGDIAEMPGAEFRSHGMLVVAPGGRHRSGVPYEGELPSVAELPELPDYMRSWTPASRNGNAPQLAEDGARIPPGSGMHNHLWAFGVRLAAKGITDVDTLAAALIGEHILRAVPGADYGVVNYSNLRKMARDLANGRVAEAVAAEAWVDAQSTNGNGAVAQAADVYVETKPSGAERYADPTELVGTPGLPEFPSDVLRGAAQAQLEEMVTHGLSPALTVAQILFTAAAVIGGSAFVEVDGTKQWANPWICALAEAGSGKSGIGDVVQAPVREHDRTYAELYREELSAWRDLSPEERKKARRPIRKRITASDATYESMARTLDANDGKVAFYHDELAGAIKGHRRYQQGDGGVLEQLMRMWANQPLDFSRVGNGGQQNGVDIYIPHPVVPIAGGLQYQKVDLLGTASGGGFRDRWLLFASDTPPTGGDGDE
jgi:hypothetical protein